MTRYNFKTNVLLKNIVGKDLINDNNIAILELIKNSYDAGAKRADVIFKNLRADKPRSHEIDDNHGERRPPEIIISDNGSGMTLLDIKNKWLNIAYSDKKHTPKKGKRFQAGNKGVGRFSCDRLGGNLDLFTRANGGKLLHLQVNWSKFEVENKPNFEIQDVPVEINEATLDYFKELTGIERLPHGTVLRITNLRSEWNRDSIISLRRSLERLFNPNQAFGEDPFEVFIGANDFLDYDQRVTNGKPKVNGKIFNKIFERLDFKTTNIESEIDSDGRFITTNLKHDGKTVYKIIEKNEYEALKSVKVVVYFLNQYKKAYFKLQTGLDSVQFGSMFVFINGFRVPPYGDRDDDWLGLDGRKTQGRNRFISSRDVIGRIEIDDTENRFQIISSREGLAQNEAFVQLKNRPDGFYYKTHKRLERFVVDGLDWDSIPKDIQMQFRSPDGQSKWNEGNEVYATPAQQKSLNIAHNLLGILSTKPETVVSLEIDTALLDQLSAQQDETVDKLLSHFEKYDAGVINSDLSKSLSRIRKIVEKQRRQLTRATRAYGKLERSLTVKEKQIEDLEVEAKSRESEILFLKSTATLDQDNLLNFIHHIGINSNTVDNYIERLNSKLNKPEPLDKSDVADFLEKVSLSNQKILTLSQFATKANFKLHSQSIKADLASFIEQYLNNVAKEFSGANLRLDVSSQVENFFEMKFKPIEISIVFDNLLNNSKKAGAKEVTVTMNKVGSDSLEVKFKDNGKGFSTEVKAIEDVFRKGFTTTTGSGLGLYHVSQIIHAMNGSITARPAETGGAEFIIRINR